MEKAEWFFSAIGALVAIFGIFGKILSNLDKRHHENMKMFFTNGGGALIQEKVKAGVLEGLAEHQITCPHKDRLENLEERMTTHERKLNDL